LDYTPDPLDTSKIQLSPEILELAELLAKNTHDTWARQRLADGWTYGPRRDDAAKHHPGLVPYEQLSESEKDYDRRVTQETLKAIVLLGFRIEKGA
jgi:RyR domain